MSFSVVAGWEQGRFGRFHLDSKSRNLARSHTSAALDFGALSQSIRSGLQSAVDSSTQVKPIKVGAWHAATFHTFTTDTLRSALGKNPQELAQFIEGHVNRVANGRIRDLHVVYSEDRIVLQGRSRTYHAKQLAHQAVLDLTDGHPLLANQIVVA